MKKVEFLEGEIIDTDKEPLAGEIVLADEPRLPPSSGKVSIITKDHRVSRMRALREIDENKYGEKVDG